jgi:hypothetical protein
MHSLPAIFTLPMRVRPNRLRCLTAMIALVLCFVIVPLAKAGYSVLNPPSCEFLEYPFNLQTRITIGQAISKFGEPDGYETHLGGHHGPYYHYNIYLYWLDEGITLRVWHLTDSIPLSPYDCATQLTDIWPLYTPSNAYQPWTGYSAIRLGGCTWYGPCFDPPYRPWWAADAITH